MLDPTQIRSLAERYTAAWCSQDAASVAAFYSHNGTLRVNTGPVAMGRAAIAAVAQGFMTEFPDLTMAMDDLLVEGGRAFYHWTLTGTNAGPGRNSRKVRISGFEEWQMREDGLIATSQGHFDSAEYQRQLQHGVA